MARVVKNPNDIVDALVSDYRAVFGEKLVSVIMYGSAVTHEFHPGVSDINIAIVLADDEIGEVARCMDVQKAWAKRKVSTPFFMTRRSIGRSLDTFPIEFLDLQSNYRILYGEDVLEHLDIKREHLRLQCERELKGAALHLRSGYIESGGNRRLVHDLLRRSLRHLLPVCKALLVLGGRNIPKAKTDIITAAEDVYHLEASVLWDVYSANAKRAKNGYGTLFKRYAAAVDALVESIDAMAGQEGE